MKSEITNLKSKDDEISGLLVIIKEQQQKIPLEEKITSDLKWNPNLSPELNRQNHWCTDYHMTHRYGIPKGKYIAVVYPKEEVLNLRWPSVMCPTGPES